MILLKLQTKISNKHTRRLEMPTLWNPTDEVLIGRYDGTNTKLNPGDKKKVDSSRAKHLITQLDPRGLTLLEYGDEGEILEKKKKDAKLRQEKFEKKQIRFYNLDNEKRKRSQKPWVDPPKEVERFAIKWSVPLVEYWSKSDVKEEALAEATNSAKKVAQENADLKSEISEMSNMLKELMADKLEHDKLRGLDGRTKAAKELKERLEGLKDETEE